MIKTRAKVLNQLKTACGFVLSFLSTIFVFVSVSFADPNIAASSNSATCKNSTLETYSGTANLSANWGANTIKLHWYADSDATTELTGSGIPTSCVYDGALTPPPVASIPQKTGYTFAGWKVRGLPDGYTKLQYIQSSGTQYINTGVKPTSSSFVKLVVMFGDSPNYRFFGSTSTSLAMGFGDGARLYVNNMNSGSHVLSNITSILNRKTTIIYKGTTVNINGTDYTCAQANAGNTDIYKCTWG